MPGATYLGHKLTTKASIVEAFKDGYRNHGTATRAPDGTPCANCTAPFASDLNIQQDLLSLLKTRQQKAEFKRPKRINLCRQCVPLQAGALNFAIPSSEYTTLGAAIRDAVKLFSDPVSQQWRTPANNAHVVADKFEEAERAVAACQSSLADATKSLAALDRIGRFQLYGPLHAKINAAIRLEKWRDAAHPPIGPLGAYVDLKDAAYSVAVEKAMGRVQIAYACANVGDAGTLRKLITRTAGRAGYQAGQSIDVLNVQREPRFKPQDIHLSADLKREGIQTVGQLVSIENDYVYNAVASYCKIDEVGLVENEAELQRILSAANDDAGLVNKFYTKSGGMAGRKSSLATKNPSVPPRCGSPLLLLTCALLMTSSHSSGHRSG